MKLVFTQIQFTNFKIKLNIIQQINKYLTTYLIKHTKTIQNTPFTTNNKITFIYLIAENWIKILFLYNDTVHSIVKQNKQHSKTIAEIKFYSNMKKSSLKFVNSIIGVIFV